MLQKLFVFISIQFYDCNLNCLNDADNDGVCDELEIYGCTDSEAYNFDVNSTENDGSCIDIYEEDVLIL